MKVIIHIEKRYTERVYGGGGLGQSSKERFRKKHSKKIMSKRSYL